MTEVSKEAVEALCLCVDESSSTTINTFEAEAVLENMAERGFTIAPIARVTDEKLREAVDLVKYYHSGNSVACDELSDAMQTIYAALTELTELRAAMTWQPIETMPADGEFYPAIPCIEDVQAEKNGDYFQYFTRNGMECPQPAGWRLPTPPKED